MDFDLVPFGKRVRLARMRLGYTQRQFSAVAGIPVPTLSLIECGKKCIRVDRLAILSRTLGVSADYLLGLSDDRGVNH